MEIVAMKSGQEDGHRVEFDWKFNGHKINKDWNRFQLDKRGMAGLA